MFPHSRNLAISGGNFTQFTHQGVRGIDLLHSASSPSAIHNSGERFSPPKCHENTRVAVVEQLMRWILGHENREALIMWLLGPAGAGKSAIAQTLAELCKEMKILLASFFFSRTDPVRNHSRSLFTTIAYQVAINFPDARDLVCRVPEGDPMVLTQSIEEQLSALIIKPLQDIYRSARPKTPSDPYLVIIDGLDECGDSAMQTRILQAISKTLSACELPLKFVIASRPEVHLMSKFNSRAINPILARLALDDNFLPNDDIRRFLEDKFTEIRQTHPLSSFIGPSWPPAETIEHLVRKSSGQFIFASTVIKYVTSTRRLPTASLDIILGLRPSNIDAPFAELDSLYINILASVSDTKKTLAILEFLIFVDVSQMFQNELNRTDFLDEFLMLSKGDSCIFAGELASIMTLGPMQEDGHRQVTLLHASLSDFLLDQSRSNQFALDPAEVHARLACRCLGSLLFKENTTPAVSLGRQYALGNLIKHCSAAAATTDLRNAILEFPHSSYLKYHAGHDSYLVSAPIIIAAIRAMPFDDAERLYASHLTIFESFLREQIPQYYNEPTLTFLAAAISTPSKVPHDLNDSAISVFFGKVQFEVRRVDDKSLNLFSFFVDYFGYRDPYKEILSGFLTTKARSGHLVLNGHQYSVAAHQCLKYLHKDASGYINSANRNTTNVRRSLTLIKWALECLPTLLDRSRKTATLVRAAQQMEFNYGVRGFPTEESLAKAAIARYLYRCTPVIVRRMTSMMKFYRRLVQRVLRVVPE